MLGTKSPPSWSGWRRLPMGGVKAWALGVLVLLAVVVVMQQPGYEAPARPPLSSTFIDTYHDHNNNNN
ncbi:MAG: hypothetical protein Q8P67_27950, partial [archaeon]|nr:hypothetical protein [archaeon]